MGRTLRWVHRASWWGGVGRAETTQAKMMLNVWENKLRLQQILSFCKVQAKILLLERNIIICLLLILSSGELFARCWTFSVQVQKPTLWHSDINTKQLQPILLPSPVPT